LELGDINLASTTLDVAGPGFSLMAIKQQSLVTAGGDSVSFAGTDR